MAQGQWHEACNQCQRQESITGQSARLNRQVAADVLDNINRDKQYFNLKDLVVNWSNLCNLTCTYCNPDASTAWQSAVNIPIQLVNNEHDSLIELARTQGSNIQGLTLGGGEPLLQKLLPEFLSCLDGSKTRVLITTNLSVDLDQNLVYKILRSWKTVEWQISFDNVNKQKFEFVRRGASWEQFVANIDILKRDGQLVNAHPAYSIYCAYDLEELYDFVVDQDINLFWCELNHPWDLDVRRLSPVMRGLAISEIDKVQQKYRERPGVALDTLAAYRSTLINPTNLEPEHYRADPLGFHSRMADTLAYDLKFQDIWTDLVSDLRKYHYDT